MRHHLDLNEEESKTLADALESLLHDLEEELAHTGSHDYKNMLHARRDVLVKVLVTLKEARPQ